MDQTDQRSGLTDLEVTATNLAPNPLKPIKKSFYMTNILLIGIEREDTRPSSKEKCAKMF